MNLTLYRHDVREEYAHNALSDIRFGHLKPEVQRVLFQVEKAELYEYAHRNHIVIWSPKFKLWLDDKRDVPDDSWTKATNAEYAKGVISTGMVYLVSLDHDLGTCEGIPDDKNTGYEVAKFIEESAHKGILDRLNWRIHSQNPVGRINIMLAMTSADKAWIADSQEKFWREHHA